MVETLYRLFDERNDLLYVGISLTFAERMSRHAKRSWFDDVRRIDRQTYPDRQSVAEAEYNAITLERPRHNIQGVSLMAKEEIELLQTIGRIRRAMPQNADVMRVCGELEKRLCQSNCPECERRKKQTRERVKRYREKS